MFRTHRDARVIPIDVFFFNCHAKKLEDVTFLILPILPYITRTDETDTATTCVSNRTDSISDRRHPSDGRGRAPPRRCIEQDTADGLWRSPSRRVALVLSEDR